VNFKTCGWKIRRNNMLAQHAAGRHGVAHTSERSARLPHDGVTRCKKII
jgi:hypothetical protein